MGTRRAPPLTPMTLVLVDAALVNLGFFLAWWLRYVLALGAEVLGTNFLPWSAYVSIQLLLTAVLLVVFKLQGLYDRRARRSWADELGILVWGALVGIAVLIVGVFYFRPYGYSRLVFVYAWATIVGLPGIYFPKWRAIMRARRS